MITAVWAGFIHACLGGSEYNIVGPTGALSGILSLYAVRYGPEILPFLCLLSGSPASILFFLQLAIMCLIVFVFRLDKYMLFIPTSVVEGFTLGVAIIIGLSQLAAGLGITGESYLYLN